MDPKEISKIVSVLPDYHNCNLDRSKLRFSGFGPRLDREGTKIWPRDQYKPDDEYRKIVSIDIEKLINDKTKCDRIRNVIGRCVGALTKVNINSLFQRYCKLDTGYFDKTPFSLPKSLESHISYGQIIDLIHATLRSLNMFRRRNEKGDFVLFLFGCNHNYDIFKEHISWLVKGNASFKIFSVGKFILLRDKSTNSDKDKSVNLANDRFDDLSKLKSMNLDKVTWLDGVEENAKYRVFIQMLYFLTRYIAELMRRYFYITISSPYSERLFYFRFDVWQKIKHYKLNQAIQQGFLTEVDTEVLGEVGEFAVSRIKYHLKKDDYRLICTNSKFSNTFLKPFYISRAVYRYILEHMQNYEKFSLNRLMKQLRLFSEKLHSGVQTQVYFVRGDVKDCYQSVNQKKLREIVLNLLKSMFPDNKLRLHRYGYDPKPQSQAEKNRLTKRVSWTFDSLETLERLFGEKGYQFTNLDNVVYDIDADFDELCLKPQLINPLLRPSKDGKEIGGSKRGYILTKGLRQGSCFSSPLSEIYIQEVFNIHLDEFYKSETCKIFRYADDILFLSVDLAEAKRFMRKMLAGFRQDFSLAMNLDKLECNFECPGVLPEYCEFTNNYCIFHKQRIQLDSLRLSYDYSYKPELHHTFRTNPYNDESSIVESLKKLRVDWLLLDCKLNGNDRVIENIFEKALLFAHRSATMIMTSLELKNHLSNQRPIFIERLVKVVAKKIIKSKERGVAKKVIDNNITHQQIRLLVSAAFYVTWRLPKLRHRKLERDKMKKLNDRYTMRHLVTSPPFPVTDLTGYGPVSSDQMELKMRELMKNFSTSSFAKEVRLPSKNSVR